MTKSKKFTRQEDNFLKKKRSEGFEFAEICLLWKYKFKLYRSCDSLMGRARRLGIINKVDTNIDQDIKIFENKSYKKALKKKYNEAIKQIRVANKKTEIALKLTKRKPGGLVNIRANDKKEEGIAISVISDWHIEEYIDPLTVNGLNEFNLEIAKIRAKNYFSNLLFSLNVVKEKFRINKLILAILGDIITGYIHEELMENNQLSPTEAVLYSIDLIKDGIDFLLKYSGLNKIIIPCCFGNHGRTTIDKRNSTAYKNSFEWLMYKYFQKIYEKNSKVKFIIQYGYHTYLPLYGKYEIRFHHGDGTIYHGGVGGIYIPMNKAIAQWNKSRKVDLDVIGHWHTFVDGGNFIVNGSLCGYSAYSLKIKASYEEPKQIFFIIDKYGRKCWVTPIFVKESEKGYI